MVRLVVNPADRDDKIVHTVYCKSLMITLAVLVDLGILCT